MTTISAGNARILRAQQDRPVFLQQRCTEEYSPLAYTRRDLRTIARAASAIEDSRGRLPTPLAASSRTGTAAGLLALNEEWNGRFYEVRPDSQWDERSALDDFAPRELLIDVQTHFMAPHALRANPVEMMKDTYRMVMPDWWHDVRDGTTWTLAEFIATVFIESETSVAVITSGPGLGDGRHLHNDEMLATKRMVEQFGGGGRILHHAVIHPNVKEDFDRMSEYSEIYAPAGWKVYTTGLLSDTGWSDGWMLDDPEAGLPFLETARKIGPRLICVHKGISGMVDNGSPRDIGPVAAAYPDLQFLVYHSGYELIGTSPAEGPYVESAEPAGVDRLVESLLRSGVGPNQNVHAELGTTWFALIRRPLDAAHVLGKLLKYVGEDNVLWGTDSIWYGSTQPIIDAFRVFQIPDDLCERYGYPKLTPAIKTKILSDNAARVYGIDRDAIAAMPETLDRTWARKAINEYRVNGFPTLG